MKAKRNFSMLLVFGLAVVFLAVLGVGVTEAAVGLSLATTPVLMFRDEHVKKKADELLRKIGINPDSVVMAPSYIQSIKEITNSESVYKFSLKSGENVISEAYEQRLDRNDIFIGTNMGYGILAVVSGAFGKAKLNTYPNQTVFPAVTTGGSEFTPDDLQVFWNSKLSLKVGNTVFIPNYDTDRFYYSPETQKSSATNYNQADGQMDGFTDLVPQVILSGEANIDLRVEVPVFTGIKVANTNSNTKNYLVTKYRGFLIKEANSALRDTIKKRLS